MYKYNEFRARLCYIALVVALASCGGNWRAQVNAVGDRTLDALTAASNTADRLTANGTMTKLQRQEFAKNVMVPATTALEEAIKAAIEWKDGQPTPAAVLQLVTILTNAIENIRKSFGDTSELLSNLITANNRAKGLLEKTQ